MRYMLLVISLAFGLTGCGSLQFAGTGQDVAKSGVTPDGEPFHVVTLKGEDVEKYAPDPKASISAENSFSAETGVAMNGYDPVHMRKNAEAIVGDPKFAVQWRGCVEKAGMCFVPVGNTGKFQREHGGVYLFSSQANRDEFLSNPPRYTPKYNGFCGWGITDYRDVTDSKPLNVAHATAVPPISEGGVYVVFGTGDDARIVGYFSNTVWEDRWKVAPRFYETRADNVWRERRQEALVQWPEVGPQVKKLRTEQAALQQ